MTRCPTCGQPRKRHRSTLEQARYHIRAKGYKITGNAAGYYVEGHGTLTWIRSAEALVTFAIDKLAMKAE